jgi:predicted secreted acid phosphatase
MNNSNYIPLAHRKAWMEAHGIKTIADKLFAKVIAHVKHELLALPKDVKPIVFCDVDETLIYNHFIGEHHEATGEWNSTTSQWQYWEDNMNIYKDAVTYSGAYEFLATLHKLGVKVVLISNSWNVARLETCLSIGGIRRGELYENIYCRHDEYSRCKKLRFTRAYYAMQEKYGAVALLASIGDSNSDDASELGGKFFLFPNPIYRDCPYFETYMMLQQSAL